MSPLAQALPRNQSEGIEAIARAGYATKGVLYVTLGVLALHTAAGTGGSVEDGEGTMKVISQQPFGVLLLLITVIGLFGYSFWRAVQTIKDTECVGDGLKGWAKRIAFGVSSLSHLALGIAGIQMLLGSASGDTKKTYLAHLIANPIGQVLLCIVGICIIFAGMGQLLQSKTCDFAEDLNRSKMDRRGITAAVWVGRIGLASRGVVFAIMGVSLIHATITKSAWKEQGLEAALNEIRTSTWGSTMLFIVAVGLGAYGVYQLVLARYRKIHAPG
jgi:Domain of Unknown Function (DUF1206)